MTILNTATSFLSSGAISLWAVGVTTYLMRSLPKKLYDFIQSRFVVKVTITASAYHDTAGILLLESFYMWFMKSENAKRSRRFMIEPPGKERSGSYMTRITGKKTLTPGIGTQFITYKGRVGWFSRGKTEKADNGTSPHELTIAFFGRDPSIITKLLEEVRYRKQEDELEIHTLSNSRGNTEWSLSGIRKKRNIKSVVTEHVSKTEIIKNIETFLKTEAWYHEHGINYKQVFLFHGIPGTGKSSLIFALASHFDCSVYIFNMNSIHDAEFHQIINNVPPKSFILFEDIDATTAQNRKEEKDENEDEPKLLDRPKAKPAVSLSTVLNALDGVGSISGTVVFITTNHIEKLDAALIRKGRVDFTYEINPLTDTEVREYVLQVFPNALLPAESFKDMTGADLQALLLEHRDSSVDFVNAIPLKQISESIDTLN